MVQYVKYLTTSTRGGPVDQLFYRLRHADQNGRSPRQKPAISVQELTLGREVFRKCPARSVMAKPARATARCPRSKTPPGCHSPRDFNTGLFAVATPGAICISASTSAARRRDDSPTAMTR